MAANNFRLERITSERSLDLFASDSGYLDFFLQKEALLHEVNDWSRTYLLIDADAEDPNDAVAGYFTLRAESQWTTGLPTENDDAPRLLPVAELALLARHRRFRGQGVGSVLLSKCFALWLLPLTKSVSRGFTSRQRARECACTNASASRFLRAAASECFCRLRRFAPLLHPSPRVLLDRCYFRIPLMKPHRFWKPSSF